MKMLNLFNLAIVIIGLTVQFDSGWCYPSGLSIFRFSRDIPEPLTASTDGRHNYAPDETTTKEPYPVSHWNIVYIVMKLDPEMRLKKVENGSQDDNVKRKEEQIDFDKIEQRLNSNGYDEQKLRGSGYLFRKDIRVDDNGFAHIHYYFRLKNEKDDNDKYYLGTAHGLREGQGIYVYQEEGLKKLNTEDNLGKSESEKVQQEEDKKNVGEETEIVKNKYEVAEHVFERTTTNEKWEAENGDEENREDLVENEEEGSESLEWEDVDYEQGDQEEETEEVYTDEEGNVIDEFGHDQSRLDKEFEAAGAEESTNIKEVIKTDDQAEIADSKVVKYANDLITELKRKANTGSIFLENHETNVYQLENFIENKNDDSYMIINDNKSRKENFFNDYINIDESWSTSIKKEQEQGRSISPEEFYDDKESDNVGEAMEIREDDEEFLDNEETEMGDSEDFQDGSG